MKKEKKRVKSGLNRPMLLFLGGFIIAYNLTIAFHELGHAIMYPIAGEQMIEFVLNPFSWSWAAGERLSVTVLWGRTVPCPDTPDTHISDPFSAFSISE